MKTVNWERSRKIQTSYYVVFTQSSYQSHEEKNCSTPEETQSSADKGTPSQLHEQNYDEQLANERLTTKDIALVISTMKKEAEYDEVSIRQLFYGYCSTLTEMPDPPHY